MMQPATLPLPTAMAKTVHLHDQRALSAVLPRLENYLLRDGPLMPLSRHPAWLNVLAKGLYHIPYCLEVMEGDRTCGFLALADVKSYVFGRFLVSLPYLNYGGPIADDASTANLLIDSAVRLADRLGVKYLELRHEQTVAHTSLKHSRTDKVNMRLSLPGDSDRLWKALDSKVRNQVRKGEKSDLTVTWGGVQSLEDFYAVFSQNMRDLGTPVYGQALFAAILEQFGDRAEICTVHAGKVPVAGALLLHGWGVTEVPSASSLREYNPTCANMLMYWHLLKRAIERGQDVFDFGRSPRDGSTMKFKKQWGATPAASEWQFYLRSGEEGGVRKESPRYRQMIRIWQRLPISVTRWLGPAIVRGIP
jgi:FemAB-related protein (PEP-CTERM system-associated)